MAQYSTIVTASAEKVWANLILKIEHPQLFVPGVSNVAILEKTEDYVVREMTVTTPETVTILKEKITFIPYKVRFLLVEHPTLEGYVDNDIEQLTENETEMTFSIHWVDKMTGIAIENYELVKSAVLKTKIFIENEK